MHYRLMYPSEYLNAADLHEQEVKVVIEKIAVEPVPGADGTKKNKPVLWFKGKQKRFPLPKTCAKLLAELFGNETDKWTGKAITIYPATCMAFGHETECIRMREAK